jgi:hypothetical protein
MYRVDHASGIPADPGTTIANFTAPRYFRGGDPITGVEATVVEAEWLNMVQEELCWASSRGGTVPLDKADRQQLLAAIRAEAQAAVGGPYVLRAGDTMTGTLTAPAVVTPSLLAYANTSWNGLLAIGQNDAFHWQITANNATLLFNLTAANATSNVGTVTEAGRFAFPMLETVSPTQPMVHFHQAGVGAWGIWSNSIDLGTEVQHFIYWTGTDGGTAAPIQGAFMWLETTVAGADLHVQRNVYAIDFISPPFTTHRDEQPWTDRGLSDVIQLQPITFEYSGDDGTIDDGERHYGFALEDARAHMPEAVVNASRSIAGRRTQAPTFSFATLVYAYINAFKEVAARLDALESARA